MIPIKELIANLTVSNYSKYEIAASTCTPGSINTNILYGFLRQFKDTFFFSYIIQFVLVTLMYVKVGKGNYWKILFYSSFAGLIAALTEHFTVARICDGKQYEKNPKVYEFLFVEIFWIITEYSIPFLNLIKMKAMSKDKLAKTINIIIHFLFVPFVLTRILIGYSRSQKGYLNDEVIQILHGIAFGIMAIADVICSLSIIYFVNQCNKRSSSDNPITDYIQHSNYTILICVDFISILLSLLYIFSNLQNKFSDDAVVPFHCFKSVFLLILATDAIIFKYGVNYGNSSYQNSSDIYGTKTHNDSHYKSSNYKSSYYSDNLINSRTNINASINNASMISNGSSKKVQKVSNISTLGYELYSPNESSMTLINNRNGNTSFATTINNFNTSMNNSFSNTNNNNYNTSFSNNNNVFNTSFSFNNSNKNNKGFSSNNSMNREGRPNSIEIKAYPPQQFDLLYKQHQNDYERTFSVDFQNKYSK